MYLLRSCKVPNFQDIIIHQLKRCNDTVQVILLLDEVYNTKNYQWNYMIFSNKSTSYMVQ